MKKLVPALFVFGLLLIFTAIIGLPHGLLRQSVLFAGIVAGISAMTMRIALLMRNE